MADYSVHVAFTFETDVVITAPDAATAEAMVMGANADQIAHLNGKNFAGVDEAVRTVVSVTEVV